MIIFPETTIKNHNFIFHCPNPQTNTTTTFNQLKEKLYPQNYFQLLQKERLQSLVLCDLDAALCGFMKNNSNVTFRCNQRKTIEAIVERHSAILQIAPTGIGKTYELWWHNNSYCAIGITTTKISITVS